MGVKQVLLVYSAGSGKREEGGGGRGLERNEEGSCFANVKLLTLKKKKKCEWKVGASKVQEEEKEEEEEVHQYPER
ncbi:hypothetical protein M0802_004144 [Mischocyttarus mexicanus]|nr:hypothetical protein M0802_004144 [Mischocyttarus mexicanus]